MAGQEIHYSSDQSDISYRASESHPSSSVPAAPVLSQQSPPHSYLQQPNMASNFQPSYSAGISGVAQSSVDPNAAGLTSQMEGLGIAGDGAHRMHRKKHRHAFHDISGGDSASVQLQSETPRTASFQFLNTGLGQAQQSVPHAMSAHQALNSSYTPQPSFPSGSPGTVQTQGKVDAEQIPSIPKSRDIPAQYYFSHVFPTMERHVPPPAAVPFVAHDQGNSSPKYARLTLNNIPSTPDFLSATALPLGMILQPLARPDPGEQPIPVLDFGDAGPPRCQRCRAYINPFMSFKAGGSKFVCNMCTFPNSVPGEYFAPVDMAGSRVDRLQRPELMMGTVEFLVPKEYWNKEPVGLRWLFLIDVSQESVSRGLLKGVCKGILNALYGADDEEPETSEDRETQRKIPEKSQVGIVTFNREVHFYNLSMELDEAQMMVMTDLDEPFVPLGEGLFVDPYESRAVISSLLNKIPSIFTKVKVPEAVCLPALNAAYSALQSTGGKIICSLGSLPTWGPGKLSVREDPKVHGTDAEKKLFNTDHTEWKKAGAKFTEAGIGVDFFITAPSGGYVDIATIGYIPGVTGGETFFYSNFHAPRDYPKLSKEIMHAIRRDTGYQALLKVRCSNGLQVSAYHGNFLQHTFGADLEIGVVDADKALGVLFSYDGRLDPKLDAHFQAALLYTSANGQRRVRCINVAAAVNEGGMETMKFIDQDSVVNIIAKEAASKMLDKPLKDIRGSITEKAVDILSGYRKLFSGSHPPGQLVLPENLKEFSMFMLSMVKSRPFKGGHESSDRRMHDMRMLQTFGCTELSLYLYPRIISIHNMRPEDGFPNEHGQLQVPPSLRASYSKIEEGGAYLVDNGQICLLWLHKQVSPDLLEDLFGTGQRSLEGLSSQISSVPVLQTHLNAQVRNLLQYFSTTRGSKAVTIQLARQGLDGAEYEFARLLMEDRNNEAQSYVDWLVHIHRQINLDLTGHRKKEESTGEGTLANLAKMGATYW